MKTVYYWGVKFSITNLNNLIEYIYKWIENKQCAIHITGVNPETVVHAKNNQTLREAIIKSDIVNIDNMLIVTLLRLSGEKIPERIATPDLFDGLLNLANKNKYKVFILGAKKEILLEAINKIKYQYSNIEIEFHDGYYSEERTFEIVEKIKRFNPVMLFLALPSPTKEIFIHNYKDIINAKLYLGIGGAIDVKSGMIKRAPKYLQKIGLEGIHRSLQNPLNYGKRYFTLYPSFFKIVFLEIFKNKKND